MTHHQAKHTATRPTATSNDLEQASATALTGIPSREWLRIGVIGSATCRRSRAVIALLYARKHNPLAQAAASFRISGGKPHAPTSVPWSPAGHRT